MIQPASRQFRDAYAAHRAAEGRGAGGTAELVALPYLRTGPLAKPWAVRARTFEQFLHRIVRPLARTRHRSLLVADLGAGNGWLCYRLALDGHRAVAVDVRTDDVDGLGSASGYRGRLPTMFARVAGSFESLPLAADTCDLVVFNAALHYATDLALALREAARVAVTGGRLVILDSPFYEWREQGEAMVAAKRRAGAQTFGARANALLAVPSIEFLTPATLAKASSALDLSWERHHVRYPLWYELRPWIARLRGDRVPSRFDMWSAVAP